MISLGNDVNDVWKKTNHVLGFLLGYFWGKKMVLNYTVPVVTLHIWIE